jgi:hypothetical protein
MPTRDALVQPHPKHSSSLAALLVGLGCFLAAGAAFANVSVSTLANASLPADTAGGSYTTLTGPALDEGVSRDIGPGTIVLNVPAGFVFDPTASVTVQVTKLSGAGGPLKLASSTAKVTTTNLTITVSSTDAKPTVLCRLTWAGIRVRPTASFPFARGNLTASGTALLAGLSASTSLGTLTETIGSASQLVLATQPPATAEGSVPFAPQPVVWIEDRFGNLRTNDTLLVSATVSGGPGSLLGTTTVAAVGGIATFTNLAYPWGATIALTFTNGSLTPATSTPIAVTGPTPSGPVLPDQADRTLYETATLVVTNTATDPYVGTGTASPTSPSATNTMAFTYASRAALLADGWSFIATNPDGTPRNTEITNTTQGAVVSYDQTAHPGTLQIPCDVGDLWGSLNSSRNSLFRSLPTNWVSLQLALSFAPTLNYQQVHLSLYQDDDNFVQAGLAHNDGLGGEVSTLVWEVGGTPDHFYTVLGGVTGIHLRLDRVPGSPDVTGYYSADGSSWTELGSTSQALVNPRLGIWVGGSPVPWTNGLPLCSLQRLDVVVTNATTATPPPVYQLVNAPPGATIDGNGIITWTPALGTGPSTNVITTIVTDNQVPPMSATNSFTVSVLPLSKGPLLPTQTNLVVNSLAPLTIVNTATEAPHPGQLATNSLGFTYTNRTALLADGWSYLATSPGGAARNTEITNTAAGALVSYDQAAHPGTLRIPCDVGDLWGSANNTRNSLFRSLPANWVSLRLAFAFSPAANYQQAHLALYQNDDTYFQAGVAFNSGEKVAVDQESGGSPTTLFATGFAGSTAQVRLDRQLSSGSVAALYSADGTTWNSLGQAAPGLPNPRLGIWVGGAQVAWTTGAPVCDLQRLDIVVTNASVPAVLTYQLLNPPTGAAIDTNGIITWTPTQAGTYSFTTVVTDDSQPPLSATNSFAVTVNTTAPAVTLAGANTALNPGLAGFSVPIGIRYDAANNLVRLTLAGAPETTYQLLWAPALVGPWTPLAAVQTDASGQALYSGPGPAPTAFFRLSGP